MRGYWRNEDETRLVFWPDQWLRTGDIARIDEEGQIYLLERSKDMILVSGFNVYPSEVEGRAVMGVIAGIFPPGMKIVFLIGAFAATFSTAFNYFDGWPRVVSVCCRNMFRPTARLSGIVTEDLGSEHRRAWYSEYNLYRGAMF